MSEVEQRNRLKLILPWLEAHVGSSTQDVAVFNAIAKVYINSNNNLEKFLEENTISLLVNSASRDPSLARGRCVTSSPP